MRKLVLIAHISLDGFVATEEGGFERFHPSKENLEFVCSLTTKADMLMAGRVSYQLLEAAWPTAWSKPNATPDEINYSNWYNEVLKIVPSRTLSSGNSEKVHIISENVVERIRNIKNQGHKNILLFGSPTLFRTLNSAGLIDEYWIILYPVLFGKGIPLFSNNDFRDKWTLINAVPFTNGEVAVHYKSL